MTKRTHDTADLLPGYAIGALTPDQRAEVEAHLYPGAEGEGGGCQQCRAELAELLEATAFLAEGEAAVAPPEALKEELLAQIAGEKQVAASEPTGGESLVAPRRSESRWMSMLPHIAAGVAALVIGWYCAGIYWAPSPADPTVAASEPAIPTLQQQEAWRRQIERTDRALGLPGARLVSVASTPQTPAVQSHLLYDELSQQLHVLVAGVANQAPSKSHWAWLIEAPGTGERQGSTEGETPAAKQGEVIAKGRLHEVGKDHSAAVLDLPKALSKSVELIVTAEDVSGAEDSPPESLPPESPSDKVLGRISLFAP